MNYLNYDKQKMKLYILKFFKYLFFYVSYKFGELLGSPQILPYVIAFVLLFIFWYGFFELAKK
jgi:hypothetical protein